MFISGDQKMASSIDKMKIKQNLGKTGINMVFPKLEHTGNDQLKEITTPSREDIEAMRIAIDDLVAEIHEQDRGNEARVEIQQSLGKKSISIKRLNSEKTGKDRFTGDFISTPSLAPAVMATPSPVNQVLNQTPSSTSSSSKSPSMTKTSPTANVSLPDPSRIATSSFSLKSTAATQSHIITPGIASFEQAKGKVLLPEDLGSILREGEYLRNPLLQKLASDGAISPAQLLKMVEKAKKMKSSLELRKGVRNDRLKQSPSTAGLLDKSTHEVQDVVADLPRQGKEISQTVKHLKEAEGKSLKLGKDSAMEVGSKTKGVKKLEMYPRDLYRLFHG